MIQSNWLSQMAELEKAATKGPWQDFEVGAWGSQGFGVSVNDDSREAFCSPNDTRTASNNAAFIAESRQFVPKAIECIRELKTILLSIQADFGDKESSQRIMKVLAKWNLE